MWELQQANHFKVIPFSEVVYISLEEIPVMQSNPHKFKSISNNSVVSLYILEVNPKKNPGITFKLLELKLELLLNWVYYFALWELLKFGIIVFKGSLFKVIPEVIYSFEFSQIKSY